MSHVNFQKQNAVSHGISPQQVAGALASTYYSMNDAHHAAFLIEVGVHTTDIVIEIHEAKSAAGGSHQLIAGKTITIAAAMANTKQIIEVDASEMTEGFDFLGIVTSCAAGAGCLASVAVVRSPLRYYPPEYV